MRYLEADDVLANLLAEQRRKCVRRMKPAAIGLVTVGGLLAAYSMAMAEFSRQQSHLMAGEKSLLRGWTLLFRLEEWIRLNSILELTGFIVFVLVSIAAVHSVRSYYIPAEFQLAFGEQRILKALKRDLLRVSLGWWLGGFFLVFIIPGLILELSITFVSKEVIAYWLTNELWHSVLAARFWIALSCAATTCLLALPFLRVRWHFHLIGLFATLLTCLSVLLWAGMPSSYLSLPVGCLLWGWSLKGVNSCDLQAGLLPLLTLTLWTSFTVAHPGGLTEGRVFQDRPT